RLDADHASEQESRRAHSRAAGATEESGTRSEDRARVDLLRAAEEGGARPPGRRRRRARDLRRALRGAGVGAAASRCARQGDRLSVNDSGNVDVMWDAEDLACGALLLRLRGRMEAMAP